MAEQEMVTQMTLIYMIYMIKFFFTGMFRNNLYAYFNYFDLLDSAE